MPERNDMQMILLRLNIDGFSLPIWSWWWSKHITDRLNQSDKPREECESQINLKHLMIRANVNSNYIHRNICHVNCVHLNVSSTFVYSAGCLLFIYSWRASKAKSQNGTTRATRIVILLIVISFHRVVDCFVLCKKNHCEKYFQLENCSRLCLCSIVEGWKFVHNTKRNFVIHAEFVFDS